MLVLIGPGWDTRRLHDPEEFVRLEITEALRHHKLIIPVLVDAISMPHPEVLPPDIRAITGLNAAILRRDPDFENDANRIVEAIRAR